MTIDGNGAYQIGMVLLTVVSAKDKFTTATNETAKAIMQRFRKGLRLDAEQDGTVLIYAPPSPGNGFPDGGYWRQPITIPYMTEFGESVPSPPPGTSTVWQLEEW